MMVGTNCRTPLSFATSARSPPSSPVNGAVRAYEAEADTPLLWVLREQLGLTGTKYGCGIAQCGACTVHIDGVPTRSCVCPASTVGAGEKVVTIEGLSPNGSHPVQKAWAALDVPQCGYCQSGMIMAAAALLKAKPNPTDTDIDEAMTSSAASPVLQGGVKSAGPRSGPFSPGCCCRVDCRTTLIGAPPHDAAK